MAISPRKQTNLLLAFKVLQFVNQLRRRVQPRILHGATRVCQLGTDVLGLRAIKRSCPRGPRVRNTKSLHHGQKHVCKRRKRRVGTLGSGPTPRGPALHVPAASDTCAEEVQQYVYQKLYVRFRLLSLRRSMLSSVDSVSPTGRALSIAAGDDRKFLQHLNAPILEGCSLNQTIQLLVTVREALGIFSACRSQHSVDWLVAQGLALGLDIDDTFVANYEHLLLRLQADLIDALARKAVEELLRGGHDKRQRKLLSLLFSEFGEKPPLSTSFPWTIKPSLAVLWGVCWMFYDRDGSEDARVRQDRLLQHLDPRSVQWSAPASSDCEFSCCWFWLRSLVFGVSVLKWESRRQLRPGAHWCTAATSGAAAFASRARQQRGAWPSVAGTKRGNMGLRSPSRGLQAAERRACSRWSTECVDALRCRTAPTAW